MGTPKVTFTTQVTRKGVVNVRKFSMIREKGRAQET